MPAPSITLYRITHERYAAAPFSGEGGLYFRSRWASNGQRVSYGAEHLALATLEKIAGVQRADLLNEMVYIKAEIASEHVLDLPGEAMPPDWDALPPTEATRAVGDAWLSEQRSVALRVPSVVLPHSYNYVVNPAHPDVATLDIIETRSLLLDNRILRQIGLTV